MRKNSLRWLAISVLLRVATRAPHALAALAALGQPTRLEIFRLLMRREPVGLMAGSIADAVGCANNTLSNHLSILLRPDSGRARRSIHHLWG
jgi:DNA-binding transcriptional ArsR family regulator